LAGLEAAVSNQLLLSGGDEAVESAAEAILASLEPALRQVVFDLAEQAAVEVAAQLPGHKIDVVIADGEPSLRVSSAESDDSVASNEDYEARISLRLPPSLKNLIEASAGETGDSVNSWLVKAVSNRVKIRERQAGTRVTGTIDL
jgi:predicted HicB family RNase H-like nuclease